MKTLIFVAGMVCILFSIGYAKHNLKYKKVSVMSYYSEFDGSTGYGNVAANAAIDFGTDDVSISFWMKTTDLSEPVILYLANTAETIGIEIYIDSNKKLYAQFFDTTSPSGAGFAYSDDDVTTGEWIFVAIVYRTTGLTANLHVYTNSTASSIYSSGMTRADRECSIFSIGQEAGSDFYNGSIDDLRIYKGIALTQTQINTIYAGGSGKKYTESDAGAGLAFNFDEGTGTKATSVGTATLDMEFTGGVTWVVGGVPFRTIALTSNYETYTKYINRTGKRIQFRFTLLGDTKVRSFALRDTELLHNR